jgi:methionyl-tRNA formyltransferase
VNPQHLRVLFIGGSHRRHAYFLRTIAQHATVAGAIIEQREESIPRPPAGIAEGDRSNFVRHFEKRDEAERRYFTDASLPDVPVHVATAATLNSDAAAVFARSLRADVALVFGSHLIRDPLFSALPRHTLNLHLGLSPRYRGAATLFWPFYFMEPTWAGATFHYLVAEPDAGAMVHQVVPGLHSDDGIHDVAGKTVVASASAATALLDVLARTGEWTVYQQRGSGKNFLDADFRAEHLRVNYDMFGDRMAAHVIDGRLQARLPRLVSQL